MQHATPGESGTLVWPPEAPTDKRLLRVFAPRLTPLHRILNPTRPALIALFALLLALTTAGCSGIQVTERAQPTPATGSRTPPSSVTDIPRTQETHDLAIAAVDFDPPLNTRRVASGEPVSLLIAVENRGNRTETRFQVSAQLFTHDRSRLLMTNRQTVNTLAAGDMIIVRSPAAAISPQQSAYILEVLVEPVPRETNTTNNRRTLEIRIAGE